MNRLFLLLFSFVLCVSLSGAAYAQSCYKAQEAEAEQGIRIHSELMVIGLGCQHMADINGKNLYLAYREFTMEHQDLFAAYERILMTYYSNNGAAGAAAEARLNKLRTSFANKISNDQAQMRPDVFCSRYAPRVEQAIGFDHDTLRTWAATIYPSHPVSQPICDGELE